MDNNNQLSAPIVSQGLLLANRYRMGLLIGQGAHGEVWAARDLLLGDEVAIKILHECFGDALRFRREVSILRMLRLPGVVRFLDDGMEGNRPYIVMERITGGHFPGNSLSHAHSWNAIKAPTLHILKTLARIHAAGVIHRDLKPENILIDEHGQPIIVDFGLSFRAALHDAFEHNAIIGTPLYIAPEQIRGDPISPATDLYTLGILLYQALSGSLPHWTEDPREFFARRLTMPPAPLHTLAANIPAHIATIIDTMLEIEAQNRPSSATDLIRALEGAPLRRSIKTSLPRIGDDKAPRRVVDRLCSGQSVDIVGPTGIGRSSFVGQIAEYLELGGIKLIRTQPSRRPFGSLSPILESLNTLPSASLSEVIAEVEQGLRNELRNNAVLIADDAEALDRLSSEAIQRLRGEGKILRVFREINGNAAPYPEATAEHLEALELADLTPLFGGFERIFHLVGDASRQLWTRTLGHPGRIVSELGAWEREGIAHRSAEKFLIDRESLDRLSAGLLLAPPPIENTPIDPSVPEHRTEILQCVELTFPDSSTALIAGALNEPVWRIEAELHELARNGDLRIRADGTLEALRPSPRTWSHETRRTMHRAFAELLKTKAERRFAHLLWAEDIPAIAIEASLIAMNHAESGYLGQAIAVLSEGLRLLCEYDGPNIETVHRSQITLISQWVELAILEGTPKGLDRVLYELCRMGQAVDFVKQLEALVRADIALMAGSDRASAMAEAVPPFENPRLERARLDVRFTAARRMSDQNISALLIEATNWANSAAIPDANAALLGWTGRLRYQEGRFEEAAKLGAQAAAMEHWATARSIALFHAAGAWMEAFRLDEALAYAQEARAIAGRCRNTYHEARSEWLLRTLEYRRETLTQPDFELVEAITLVGVPDLEALVCITEASLLFRLGDRSETARLAERARRIWTGMNKGWGAKLARCLAMASGASLLIDEARTLAEEAFRCPISGIGIQMLGLLAMGFPEERRAFAQGAEALAAQVPRSQWKGRIDILSVQESLEALIGPEAGL